MKGILKVLMCFNLQLFADVGTLVNATGQYVNAYTGSGTSFSGTDDLTPTMKTFYDTELLENHRDQLIFAGSASLPSSSTITSAFLSALSFSSSSTTSDFPSAAGVL